MVFDHLKVGQPIISLILRECQDRVGNLDSEHLPMVSLSASVTRAAVAAKACRQGSQLRRCQVVLTVPGA
jgi:hypothetical protein